MVRGGFFSLRTGVRGPSSCTRECPLACLGRGVWGAQLFSKPELVSRIHPSLWPAVHHPFPPRPTAGDQASQGTRDPNIYTRVPGRSRRLVFIFPILLPTNGSEVAPGLAGCMLRSLPSSLHLASFLVSFLRTCPTPHGGLACLCPALAPRCRSPLSLRMSGLPSPGIKASPLGPAPCFCPRPDDTHSPTRFQKCASWLFPCSDTWRFDWAAALSGSPVQRGKSGAVSGAS